MSPTPLNSMSPNSMSPKPKPTGAPPTSVHRPTLVHLTTTDMSLDWLLGPQLRAFVAAGYDVIGMSAPGSHVAALEAAGVRHIAIESLRRASSPRHDLAAGRELVRALRMVRPDVLHTHNPKPGVIGRVIGRALRIPVVVNTQHGLYAQPTDRRRRRWPVYVLERLAASCSHAELVQNPEDAATLVDRLRVPSERVTVLGNGVDLDRFDRTVVDPAARERLRAEWGIADEEVVCIVVGRLVAEKGFGEVFAAARALRSTPARWVVVGPVEADKSDAIDAAAIARAEADGVVFAGRRDDMAECYSAADLFVTATYREGFPRAAMEAAAMGLAVVATDVRGCRQVVADGVNGVLVPARDAARLAEAVACLVVDEDARAQLAAAARPRAVEHFDQRRVIDTTLATYARLLDRRSLPRR